MAEEQKNSDSLEIADEGDFQEVENQFDCIGSDYSEGDEPESNDSMLHRSSKIFNVLINISIFILLGTVVFNIIGIVVSGSSAQLIINIIACIVSVIILGTVSYALSLLFDTISNIDEKVNSIETTKNESESNEVED